MKKKRERLFRSAREFSKTNKLGISYPQYSRYEAGLQLPSLDQALKLCQLLSIPILEGLHEWCIAQIQDSKMMNELREEWQKFPQTQPPPSPAKDPSETAPRLDDVLVFNRRHLELFRSDPTYRDVFTYINAFNPRQITAPEIAAALSLPLERVQDMLRALQNLGVIELKEDGAEVSKTIFYFPEDEAFFDLRNQNLRHNFNAVLERLSVSDLEHQRAYRALFSRELNPEQLELLIRKLEEVGNTLLQLPESKDAHQIYSLCLLLGERFSKPQKWM